MLNLKSSKMNTSIKIICKKQPHANGLYPIYLRVTINRKSKFYSTPFTCKLTEWDHKQGEFKSKYKNHLTFNKTLRKLKDNASDVVNLLEQDYESYNLILFDKYYSRKMDEDISFKEFFEREIKNLLNNSQVSYAKSMQNALTVLIQFEDNLGNYKFENIDFQFLTNFENFIRRRGGNDGGIAVYMRNIRTIYNRAINYKIVQPQYYPFRDFKISKFKKKKIKKALTEVEFKKLLDFDIEKIAEAKNALYAYLFSYYARGMNFTNMAELKWSDMNGYSFQYHRNKTDALLKIKLPVLPIIDKILAFYKIYRPYDTPFVFPILNQDSHAYTKTELMERKDNVRMYYNKQLALISKACGLEKNIYFYSARHTFATAALRNNVNINIIKQSLGHKRLSTTENYLEDFHDNEVDQVILGIF